LNSVILKDIGHHQSCKWR